MISEKEQKIEAIKKVQAENIDSALTANKKLKLLEDKAKALEDRAKFFAKISTELENSMNSKYKKNQRWVLLGVLLFGIAILACALFLGTGSVTTPFHSVVYFLISIILGSILGVGLCYGIYLFSKREVENYKNAIEEAIIPGLKPSPRKTAENNLPSRANNKSSTHIIFNNIKNLKNSDLKPQSSEYDQSSIINKSRYRTT